jgi:hypothetical protein
MADIVEEYTDPELTRSEEELLIVHSIQLSLMVLRMAFLIHFMRIVIHFFRTSESTPTKYQDSVKTLE